MWKSFGHLRQYLRFLGTPTSERRLVVYSEGPAYWPHLGPVVMALLARPGVALAYVSSSAADPGVQIDHPACQAFVIGDGATRTMFFASLQADLLLLTMPDLDSFHLKRSKHTRHVAFLHHSLVSCHMAYQPGAFDAIDTMLCAGPHHAAEMRAIERQRGLAPKQLVNHGYGRLDALRVAAATAVADADPPLVLVAPSWGPQGLLEAHAGPLMAALARCPWNVVVRPHPQTFRLAPQAIEVVRRACREHAHLQLEEGVAGHASLARASVMVSDWSGAAFDFALGFERPVLFVDVPRKVNNPRYAEIDIEPIEVAARSEIGEVIAVEALGRLPERLEEMLAAMSGRTAQLRSLRSRWVWHPGHSAQVATDWLADQVAQMDPGKTQ